MDEAHLPCLHHSLSLLSSLMSTVETATTTTVEPLDDHGSAVRFEPQCVVIPDPAHRSRRPRVVTKSYALPLWKRRTSPARPCPPEDAPLEENQSHLVLRVPLPTHVSSSPVDILAAHTDSAPVFRADLTRRPAQLTTLLSRLVSYIVLSRFLIPPVPALPDIPAPRGNPPLLRLAQT